MKFNKNFIFGMITLVVIISSIVGVSSYLYYYEGKTMTLGDGADYDVLTGRVGANIKNISFWLGSTSSFFIGEYEEDSVVDNTANVTINFKVNSTGSISASSLPYAPNAIVCVRSDGALGTCTNILACVCV